MLVDHEARLYLYGRREVLGLLSLLGLAATLDPSAAIALEGNDSTKGGAWLLGDKLSLAALLYDQNAPASTVDSVLSRAKNIAKIFELDVAPFPAKSKDSAASSADIVHYLIAGDGARLGTELARRYGEAHGILFEVAVKSNLLIPLYGPGDGLGLTIARVIRTRLDAIHLPTSLWSNLVTLVENKASQGEVKDAVFKMHQDIANYYLPGSGR